jgi:hypothetical protein
MMNRDLIALGGLSLGLLLTGCQTYNDQNADVTAAWKGGDYQAAAEKVRSKASGAPERDKLLWLMEEGAILQMAGDPDASIAAFDSAEAIINSYEEQAKVKLGSEAAALLSNQATLPYRGYAYDKIMVNTLKSMNFAQNGDFAAARVEINRAYQRQQDAVAENQREIEKAQAAAQAAKRGEVGDGKRKESYDVDRAKGDPNVRGATDGILSEIDKRSLPYANYVNPFAVFWEGIFFSYAGTGSSDFERALKAFERLRAMSPSEYIEADFQMASNLANGMLPEPTTYVLFATGTAPTREEFQVEIPLFVVSTVSYAAASFPRLRFEEDYVPQLALTSGNPKPLNTALLADMDSIVALEFKNDWPIVLTKTLITTGVKATIGYMAEKAVENEDWKVQLAAKVANVALQSATNRADLRTWTTLPKRFGYLRTATPTDGLVKLSFGSWSKEVIVDPRKTNFIFVRSPNSAASPIITQFSI